jgi:hypothetical protein
MREKYQGDQVRSSKEVALAIQSLGRKAKAWLAELD